MTVGPIPDPEISTFIEKNSIGTDAKLFRDCIRAMDAEYLNHVAKGDKADRVHDEPFRPGMLRGKT